MNSFQGKALVASPYLTDPFFMRTVVYILQHDSEGAVGLVLNRPLNLTVGQLLGELIDTKVTNKDPVFYGGPVDGLVMMIQACIDVSSEKQVVVIAKDREHITDFANKKEKESSSMRLFDGYSGWGPSQLDRELDEGSWLLWEAEPTQLFAEPGELWQSAVRQIGRDVIAKGVAGEDLFADPSRN